MDDSSPESFAAESNRDPADAREPEPGSPALPVPDHLDVDVTVDEQVSAPVPISLLQKAVTIAVNQRGFSSGEIGIRLTDDKTIRQINARYLDHDYATDVISFGYSAEASRIEGEMVISVDTARVQAIEIGWSTDHELCLYAVHGALHITGMDDQQPQPRAEMRAAEAITMRALGIKGFESFQVDRHFGRADEAEGETA